MPQAGRLNRLFTLLEPAETVAAGVGTPASTDRGSVWGRLEGLSGTSQAGIVAEATYRILLYFRADVRPRWRLALRGTTRVFEILSALDPDGRQESLAVVAQEVL